jgi:CBS domain-containing protein
MVLEKVKESAKRGLTTGRARMDQTRAQRQRNKLLLELGEVTYREHTGQATREAVAAKARALDDFERALREQASGQRRAKDIMHAGAECADENDTVATAAQKMRDLGVGSLPICGADDRLHGIITDRDIVVRCIAEEQDPGQARVRDFALGPPAWVDAGADVSEVLRHMEQRQVKRLPVIENHRLVGIISEADLARNLDEHRLAEFVEKVYATS